MRMHVHEGTPTYVYSQKFCGGAPVVPTPLMHVKQQHETMTLVGIFNKLLHNEINIMCMLLTDWNGLLDHWNGLLEYWNTGMDYAQLLPVHTEHLALFT